MSVRSLTRGLYVALVLFAAGCDFGKKKSSILNPVPSWLSQAPLELNSESAVARAAPPSDTTAVENATAAMALPTPSTAKPSVTIPPPDKLDSQLTAIEPPIALPSNLPPIAEPPGAAPARPASAQVEAQPLPTPKPVPPGEFLPPIPSLPDSPLPPPVKSKSVLPPRASEPARTSEPLPAPSTLPPLTITPSTPELPIAGPIELNGSPVPFDTLSKLVDGNICSNCGGAMGISGCESCGPCGPAQCRAGGCRAEPFPAKTALGRTIGMIYSNVCCPDPCYQPKWEPLADAAFFVDAVRPKTSTRFRWDYGYHLAYPDRGESFFARGDGSGRGPKANPPLLGIPYVDYHELMLITEIGTGAAGVQIAVPYRSVNSTPFGADGAGFSDMTITAKTMLFDSELFLFGFQMRTYIPIGQTGKGLGTGHTSLEPGLNIGLRAAPRTYLQAQVVEWIPLGGDKDYQGAHLRWAGSINHILWQPVKDVQLIGTLESTGINYQDGLFTDPVLGPQRLARRTIAHIGAGLRLFFCDTFDIGLGWQHGITGKYLMRDMTRFEVRYRY